MRLLLSALFVLYLSCTPTVTTDDSVGGRLDPISAKWLRAGKVAFLKGDYTEAERCFRNTSGCAEGAYWLGRALCAQRRYGEARVLFDAAAEKFSGWRRLDALVWGADCAMWFHDFADAARRYGDALQMGGEPAEELRLKLAVALLRSGAWDDAAEQFRKVLLGASTKEVEEKAQRGLFHCARRHFAIQVAAFRHGKPAKRLADDLKKQGLDAYTVFYPEGLLYLVWVGRFGSYGEASEALSRIRREERFEEAVVVP